MITTEFYVGKNDHENKCVVIRNSRCGPSPHVIFQILRGHTYHSFYTTPELENALKINSFIKVENLSPTEYYYPSSSKGPLLISTMNDVHLINAIKAATRDGDTNQRWFQQLCYEAGKRGLII